MLIKSLLSPELKVSIPLDTETVSTLPYLKAIKLNAHKCFSKFIKVPQTSWLDQAGAGDSSSHSWISNEGYKHNRAVVLELRATGHDGSAAHKWSV